MRNFDTAFRLVMVRLPRIKITKCATSSLQTTSNKQLSRHLTRYLGGISHTILLFATTNRQCFSYNTNYFILFLGFRVETERNKGNLLYFVLIRTNTRTSITNNPTSTSDNDGSRGHRRENMFRRFRLILVLQIILFYF